uniref:F5/8 type C domain-containing protein n=1 Tax=Branchiostoma floridae TaxID=7739 RepID=C3XU38_BRAFL|eukprot:XP_002612403.1 hypothetical protein BRAFLDRAFT_121962 [Branchiostoma floridae]
MATARLLAALAIFGVLGLKFAGVKGAPAPSEQKVDPILRSSINLVQTDLKDVRRYMHQIEAASSANQESPISSSTVAHTRIVSACIDDKVYRKGKSVVSINGREYTSRYGNVNIVTFNQTTGQVTGQVAFDTSRGQGGDMRVYLDQIPPDRVVLIAIRDVAVSVLPTATDHKLIEDFQLRLTNSTKADEENWFEKDTSWVIEETGTPHVSHGHVYDAAKVLDGRGGTLWNPGGEGRYYNNWNIEFDFQAFYQISSIRIHNYGDWTHDVTKFVLQASYKVEPYEWIDAVFGELQDTRNVRVQEFGGFSTTARFWRFLVQETGNGYQPWLCELDFFGYKTPMMASFASIVKKGSKTSWAIVDSNMIVDGATVIETVIPLDG